MGYKQPVSSSKNVVSPTVSLWNFLGLIGEVTVITANPKTLHSCRSPSQGLWKFELHYTPPISVDNKSSLELRIRKTACCKQSIHPGKYHCIFAHQKS